MILSLKQIIIFNKNNTVILQYYNLIYTIKILIYIIFIFKNEIIFYLFYTQFLTFTVAMLAQVRVISHRIFII